MTKRRKGNGAGRYRHSCTIERNTPTTVNRELVDDWQTYITRKGSIKPVKAIELQQDANQEVLISHTIRFRYDANTVRITERDRVKFQPGHGLPARWFQITSVFDPDERQKEIELEVIERSFER